jgi:hypothetical protein
MVAGLAVIWPVSDDSVPFILAAPPYPRGSQASRPGFGSKIACRIRDCPDSAFF